VIIVVFYRKFTIALAKEIQNVTQQRSSPWVLDYEGARLMFAPVNSLRPDKQPPNIANDE
jgi:hypothetical protein